MILSFLCYLAVCNFQNPVQPPLSFAQEYIEFGLKDASFTVNGLYVFVNNTKGYISKEIHYPFPVSISKIDSVHVFEMGLGYLKFEKHPKEIIFHLNVRPLDTAKVNIFYRQREVTDTITYILTTTKIWGEALKNAEYTFTVDRTRKILSFSYPPDKTTYPGNDQKYFWKRENFLPTRDFVVILAKSQ
jgi:hypothetical protein